MPSGTSVQVAACDTPPMLTETLAVEPKMAVKKTRSCTTEAGANSIYSWDAVLIVVSPALHAAAGYVRYQTDTPSLVIVVVF